MFSVQEVHEQVNTCIDIYYAICDNREDGSQNTGARITSGEPHLSARIGRIFFFLNNEGR